MIFTGCPESQKETLPADKALGENITIPSGNSSFSTMNECDEFIRDYEAWVNNYVSILKRFQKNPKDKTIIADYQIMVGQIGQWDNRSRQCIKDSAILKRYVELQEMLNDHAVQVVSN
jgi:hypothetical protein